MSTLACDAQKEKRTSTKKQMKEQVKAQDNNRQDIESNYAGSKNRHYDIQNKSVKKRMRANRKRAKKREKNRSVPFYERWFRRGHFR